MRKAIRRVCLKNCWKQRSWNYYKRRLTPRRQQKKRDGAKSRKQREIGRLIQLGSERELSAAKLEVEGGGPNVPSTRVTLGTQDHHHRTEEHPRREVHDRGARLTHTFQEGGAIGPLAGETGLARDPHHAQLLAHHLQIALKTAVDSTQGLDLPIGRPGHDDHVVLLDHHLGREVEREGGDQSHVVIDHSPIHTLVILAHVRPEDAESPLNPHHRAFHHLHHQDIIGGNGGLSPAHGRDQSQEIVIAGKLMEGEDLEDHTQLIHQMIEERHGLMLSRTVFPETTVV